MFDLNNVSKKTQHFVILNILMHKSKNFLKKIKKKC